MDQGLRLHISTAGGTDLIPGRRTKIPCAAQLQKEKKKISHVEAVGTAPLQPSVPHQIS